MAVTLGTCKIERSAGVGVGQKDSERKQKTTHRGSGNTHWTNIEIKHLRISKPARSLVSRAGIFANGFLDFSFFGFLDFLHLAANLPGEPAGRLWGNPPRRRPLHAL